MCVPAFGVYEEIWYINGDFRHRSNAPDLQNWMWNVLPKNTEFGLIWVLFTQIDLN